MRMPWIHDCILMCDVFAGQILFVTGLYGQTQTIEESATHPAFGGKLQQLERGSIVSISGKRCSILVNGDHEQFPTCGRMVKRIVSFVLLCPLFLTRCMLRACAWHATSNLVTRGSVLGSPDGCSGRGGHLQVDLGRFSECRVVLLWWGFGEGFGGHNRNVATLNSLGNRRRPFKSKVWITPKLSQALLHMFEC